uniref:NADH-ubiquinone oxidoreductase chain 5 n=1 Tax=Chlorotetraedron incus TaxID=162317 RepID=A0A076VF04_9CHLO|nr:NADH dehydrogenase subunit 5 [Chlorotetraedron incus]AIK29113.1 NADH dehydrogenase subunit 5 [Chlorotetraedron incus]
MYLCAVAAPFLGSALAGLAGRWLGARGSGCVAVLGLGTSAVLSFLIYYEICLMGAPVILDLGPWFSAGTVNVSWILNFDALSAVMMVTVTGVSFCVHLYSLGYMQADPHLPRFLCYLSLFTGSMLLLVTGTDFVTMLVGWEMIGVCSYLLIGFWFHRLSATKAAQKAVLVNRVSDTGLLVGLMVSWWYLGSTDFSVLTATSTTAAYVDMLCLTILVGSLGKSAQVGLHVWLADAMEGPTPVSALIHAATLVTAGVYLVARTSCLWECSTLGRSLLVWIGAVTSLMAATMGLVQNDLKRVIAYSTCSQLGYMMVACGLSSYGLAIYHLMTHACFKALLFLGAGVAIHATADVQDLRRQGGGHQALPWAWATLLLGSLSLMGWPFLAGYYSKDAILELCWATPGPTGVYSHILLMVVAAFTRAYSFRVLVCAFMAPANARRTEVSHTGVPYTMAVPLLILSIGSIVAGYVLSDSLIGWGSTFWGTGVQTSPATLQAVSSHMLPVWVAWLPLLTVPIGYVLAQSFTMPLPWCRNPFIKAVYLFLQARWMFDFVWNQQVAKSVLNLGTYTWAVVDKGVLEVLGPRGLRNRVTNWAVPLVRQWQTGTVHDYALIFKIAVIAGLIALALPHLWAGVESHLVYARALTVAVMLLVLAP